MMHKKLLILQIDALSHPRLIDAINKGYLPFLKAHLKRNHIQEYNCSLPSSTPCVQSGLLYGDEEIPGFFFIDKRNKRFHSFYSTKSAREISSAFKNPGVITGGSAYSVIFSGDAHKTMFVLGHGNTPTKMSARDAFFYSIINPFVLVRMLFRISTQWLLEIMEFLYYGGARILSKEYYTPFRPDYWFRRLFFNAFANTVAATAVRQDIKKGVPRIYINFNSFDDMAHIRGPSTKAAYRTLRIIDAQIRRIIKKAKEYDTYIYSDHGMMDSVSFRYKYGMSFTQFLESILGEEGVEVSKYYDKQISVQRSLWAFLSGGAKAILAPLWGVIKPFWIYFRPDAPTRKIKGKEFVVAESSNVAQVYFLKRSKRLEVTDIEDLQENLLESIIFHPGVGIVLVRKGDRFNAYAKEGSITLPHDAPWMKRFNTTGRDLLNFARRKQAGDLIILGNIIGDKCIAFEDQAGVHGGAGGDQQRPFILSPRKLPPITSSSELYSIFRKYMHTK